MKTPEAKKALDLQDQLRAEYARIRANQQLSARGRAEQLQVAHAEAREKMTELRRQELARLGDRYDTLERDLFGSATARSGADLIAYRDAADRAANLTEETALPKMRDALARRDHELASAIAHRAVQLAAPKNGWGDVFDVWQAARPGTSEVVDELAAIEDYRDYRGPDALLTWSTPEPHEVRTTSGLNRETVDDTGVLAR